MNSNWTACLHNHLLLSHILKWILGYNFKTYKWQYILVFTIYYLIKWNLNIWRKHHVNHWQCQILPLCPCWDLHLKSAPLTPTWPLSWPSMWSWNRHDIVCLWKESWHPLLTSGHWIDVDTTLYWKMVRKNQSSCSLECVVQNKFIHSWSDWTGSARPTLPPSCPSVCLCGPD
jgi:hypothetical protein